MCDENRIVKPDSWRENKKPPDYDVFNVHLINCFILINNIYKEAMDKKIGKPKRKEK